VRAQHISESVKNKNMKRLLLGVTFFFCCIIVLQSCSKDDSYYNLSEEAKAFLLYEEGDTFQLKNTTTNEIITLTVTNKEFAFSKGGTPGSIYSGIGSDSYYQYGSYSFTDSTNCYNGNFMVEAKKQGDFEMNVYLGGCFGSTNFAFEYQDEFFTSIDVAGVNYANAYLFRSAPNFLYYSKEKGILKIIRGIDQEELFTIVD
jgi:hypothetical protein